MARFGFAPTERGRGSFMPVLRLELRNASKSVQIAGIIDTAAKVSVMPYHLGLALGAVWEAQRALGYLAGALSGSESRALALTARSPEIADSSDVPL